MWTLLDVFELAIGIGANVCARQESGKARSQIIQLEYLFELFDLG